MKLDLIDCKILQSLQTNGRLSNQELADQIALSPSACFRRVKQLEQAGVIQHYQAVLNYKKIGYSVEAIIHVSIDQTRNDWHDKFVQQISTMQEIINAYIVTGDCNHILFVRTHSLDDFSHFVINKLNKINGVKDLCTYIVLDCIQPQKHPIIQPST